MSMRWAAAMAVAAVPTVRDFGGSSRIRRVRPRRFPSRRRSMRWARAWRCWAARAGTSAGGSSERSGSAMYALDQNRSWSAYLIPVGVLVAFIPFFAALVRESARNPYAGHVVFVPILSVVII